MIKKIMILTAVMASTIIMQANANAADCTVGKSWVEVMELDRGVSRIILIKKSAITFISYTNDNNNGPWTTIYSESHKIKCRGDVLSKVK